MNSFKKIMASVVSFVIVIIICSTALIEPYINSESKFFFDSKSRGNLCGTLDMLIVGSCMGQLAFVPEVIDKQMNCSSYNLCGFHFSPDEEVAILKEEINRNPVSRVVIGMDYDTLSFPKRGTKAEGIITLVPRLNAFGKRAKYILENVYLEDYPILYTTFLRCGITYWHSVATGSYTSNVDASKKGYKPAESKDASLLPEECAKLKCSKKIDTNVIDEHSKKLIQMINMCKERKIFVVLAMPPMPDSFVWKNCGLDTIYKTFSEFAEDNQVRYLDFNLLKAKSKLLNDKDCYENEYRLSSNGAAAFSKEFCKIISSVERNEDVSDLFYNSYEEALKYSPYAINNEDEKT